MEASVKVGRPKPRRNSNRDSYVAFGSARRCAGFLFKFPTTIGFIKDKKVACAGFELLNSLYATQVQADRVITNFRLTVTGHENEL